MKKHPGATLSCFFLAASALAGLSANAGTTSAFLVLPGHATPPERTAARELHHYLPLVAGGPFPIVTETEKLPPGPRIYVGPTVFARRHGIDSGRLGPEEWRVRSAGENLIVTGGRPRGTLYAAYHFLEDAVGVHWWNPWEETVPHKAGLDLTGLDLKGTPVLRYRDIYMTYGRDGGRFAARNRLNRNGDRRIVKEYGGCRDYGPPYHVHTFYKYVPPAKYFKSHPEYFSLVRGKRTADHAQLCLTNPDVRALCVQKLEAFIEQARTDAARRGVPAPDVFDISQNDWGGACQCKQCRRIAKAEGAESGVLLDFLNFISDAVKSRRPGIYIDTLAYQYTQEPPAHIRPRDNIIIRLCDTTSNFTRPITAKENRRFHDILLRWAAIAKNLRVWDYAVTYGVPRGLPFPSVQTYAPDFRFYAEHHVEGVFTELEFPVIADMRDLKVWMMMKLLENPYRDSGRLLKTFTDGFYGPAGALVRQYLTELERACADKGSYVSMGTSISGMGYLDWPFIGKAQALFDRAEAAVAHDPVRLRRVRHARLPLDRATLIAFKRLVRTWQRLGHDPATFPLNRKNVANRCRSTWFRQIALRIPQARRKAEERKAEEEIARYTALPVFVPLPNRFRNLPKGTVFDFTADLFRNWKQIVRVVKDPDAESGITARLEFPTRIDSKKQPLEKYKLPMPWGLYQPSAKKFVGGATIKPSGVPGPGYHWYKMGPYPIGPSTYLYFFWSWIIQLDIDSVIDPKAPDAKVVIWARIKFEGPAFPHGRPGEKNAICVERVVLVKSGATR